MSKKGEDFSSIPGTYVMTPAHSRIGYHLNMFCKSLDISDNRDRFRNDPEGYLAGYKLSESQRQAIEQRDWLGMLQLGGNIYYTFKLAIFDGFSMQAIGGKMSGVTEEEFARMMIDGGRRPDAGAGN